MFRVILSDPLVCIGKPELYVEIARVAQGFFDQIAKRLPTKDRIVVMCPPARPDGITDRDLIVYFTPTEFSVVARLTQKIFDPLAAQHWGFTGSEPGLSKPGQSLQRASEVYPRFLNAAVLGRLVFHECMHNKLQMGNEMHAQGGMAAASVGPDSKLNEANIASMAAAMHKPVRQWPEGFDKLMERKALRDAYPDSWYL